MAGLKAIKEFSIRCADHAARDTLPSESEKPKPFSLEISIFVPDRFDTTRARTQVQQPLLYKSHMLLYLLIKYTSHIVLFLLVSAMRVMWEWELATVVIVLFMAIILVIVFIIVLVVLGLDCEQ